MVWTFYIYSHVVFWGNRSKRYRGEDTARQISFCSGRISSGNRGQIGFIILTGCYNYVRVDKLLVQKKKAAATHRRVRHIQLSV